MHPPQTGPDRQVTVADALVALLARGGVRDVFGVAGSTIMPLLDGIAANGHIRYVGARHEQSAADMASGYARTSGRLGVVLTHVGPGATSCVTSIVGAARDGVPMLLITGNEESETLVREPYHDWDIMGAMGAVTNFSYRITRVDQVPHVLRRALGQAMRGAAQPVHIDLPEDIALATIPAEQARQWHDDAGPILDDIAACGTAPATRIAPNARAVAGIADMLAEATAPVLLIGEAAFPGSDPDAIVRRCVDLGVPYAATFGAHGGIGERPGYVGTIGRFGSRSTTAFVAEADCVVALGAELSDIDTVRWSLPKAGSRLALVHPDTRKVDLRLPADIGVIADAEEFLDQLTAELADRETRWPPQWLDRAAAVDLYDGPAGDTMAGDIENAPLDARLVGQIVQAAPASWAVAIDPGFGPLTLTAPARLGTSRFLYPYGFGYMGFAVPNAIGAVISGEVDGAVAVLGDGSFFMSMAAVESVAALEVPVVVIVLDDGGFGSQRKKQREAYGGRNVGVDYDNPNIAAIGTALGLESRWVTSAVEIESFCRTLPQRRRGALLAVARGKEQSGSWYEGSVRPLARASGQ
ncbi:thiamine pyrophosphate-binding protein [Salinactinospora qingdaonensis]|uniref:Acetolactate synthase large subunit n=1 Tax=Salinactinospora qingdaonensis TaxID=702744 RepID=A0ABP7FWL3_9ACTN